MYLHQCSTFSPISTSVKYYILNGEHSGGKSVILSCSPRLVFPFTRSEKFHAFLLPACISLKIPPTFPNANCASAYLCTFVSEIQLCRPRFPGSEVLLFLRVALRQVKGPTNKKRGFLCILKRPWKSGLNGGTVSHHRNNCVKFANMTSLGFNKPRLLFLTFANPALPSTSSSSRTITNTEAPSTITTKKRTIALPLYPSMFVFAQFLFLLLPPTLSLSLALLSQSARTEKQREKGGERKNKRINWFHFLPLPP